MATICRASGRETSQSTPLISILRKSYQVYCPFAAQYYIFHLFLDYYNVTNDIDYDYTLAN